MEIYTKDFFKKIQDSSLHSAKEVVPLVMRLVQPKRVIDVGCGVGSWLSVFKEYGVEDILGVDGDYVDAEMLQIPQECFLARDLVKPLRIEQHFDLVVSLEVAEHLPSECAEDFINTLVSLGPVILFSAALPYQRGDSHVNEQWPDYWLSFFHQKGYVLVDCLRMKLWQNDSVEWWYSQNMLIFVKQICLQNYPLLKQEFDNGNLTPLSIVHPKMHLQNTMVLQHLIEYSESRLDGKDMTLKQAWSLFTSALKNALLWRINKVFLRNHD